MLVKGFGKGFFVFRKHLFSLTGNQTLFQQTEFCKRLLNSNILRFCFMLYSSGKDKKGCMNEDPKKRVLVGGSKTVCRIHLCVLGVGIEVLKLLYLQYGGHLYL